MDELRLLEFQARKIIHRCIFRLQLSKTFPLPKIASTKETVALMLAETNIVGLIYPRLVK